MAIGAGLGAWIGGAIGTFIPIPFVGTAIGAFLGGMGGDKLGGAIYDFIFSGKEPENSKKINKKSNEFDEKPSTTTSSSVVEKLEEKGIPIRNRRGRITGYKNTTKYEKE